MFYVWMENLCIISDMYSKAPEELTKWEDDWAEFIYINVERMNNEGMNKNPLNEWISVRFHSFCENIYRGLCDCFYRGDYYEKH